MNDGLLSEAQICLLTLENLEEYVLAVDADCKILFLSRSIINRKREEYVGTDLLSYLPADQGAQAREAIHRAFATGEKQRYEAYTRGRAFECRVTPIQQDGKTIFAAVVAFDVDDMKRWRERAEEMERRLMLSERLASMGSLASCIAHEINNPLTYIVGNLSYIADALSSLAQDDTSGKCRQIERAVADVREGVDRVRSVVSDLSMLSQPEYETRTCVDVRRVLEASINVAKNEIRHRARLEREYKDALPVIANEALLGQVFLNLLLTTARAMPEGPADRNVIRVLAAADGDRTTIHIHDSGLGALPEDFAFCRTIVTGFGGDIIAESGILRVVLPSAPGALKPPSKTADPAVDSEATPRARILVVDDEAVIASTMRHALDRHDVYIVTSGRDALELCRGEDFDLVVCDLMMPDLTGMDLYDELKKDGKGGERRIIFMTGGAFTPRARKFLASVPNPWLKKPFDAEEIQTVVARAFEQR